MVRPAQRGGGGVGEGVLSGKAKRAGSGRAGAGSVISRELLFTDAGLERRGPSLYLGTVSLSEIALEVGTPVYVYHADPIRERYRMLDAALQPLRHRICFAVKANSTLGVLRILRDLGAGADIVSAGEMARALAAGFPADRIVFSGVGKAAAELRQAVRAGLGHLNIESVEELERLAMIAGEEGVDMGVGIRVNPDVTADTHPYISTGRSGIKFGVPVDQVRGAAARIAAHPRLHLTSIAMHLGS